MIYIFLACFKVHSAYYFSEGRSEKAPPQLKTDAMSNKTTGFVLFLFSILRSDLFGTNFFCKPTVRPM